MGKRTETNRSGLWSPEKSWRARRVLKLCDVRQNLGVPESGATAQTVFFFVFTLLFLVFFWALSGRFNPLPCLGPDGFDCLINIGRSFHQGFAPRVLGLFAARFTDGKFGRINPLRRIRPGPGRAGD